MLIFPDTPQKLAKMVLEWSKSIVASHLFCGLRQILMDLVLKYARGFEPTFLHVFSRPVTDH